MGDLTKAVESIVRMMHLAETLERSLAEQRPAHACVHRHAADVVKVLREACEEVINSEGGG